MASSPLPSRYKPAATTPISLWKKHRQGRKLSSDCKQMVLSVYAKLREQHRDRLRDDLYQLTSEYTGVGAQTVVAVKKEAVTNSGLLRTPTGKRPKSVGTRRRLVQYDSFVLSALRSCLHGFFRRNKTPTITKVREAFIEVLKDDETVYRLLLDIGFELQKKNRNSLLIEKDDILVWHAKHLRSILKFRAEGKVIYYRDETCIYTGHTVNKIWVDTTVRSARDAGNLLSGKDSRLIVTHVGGDEGFVEGCLDIFHGVKSDDYHDKMDGNRFERWFDLFLTKVEPGSVIVMNNASYHSRRVECVPMKSSIKSVVIQEWLSSKGIDWDKDMLKQAIKDVTKDNWTAAVEHVKKMERQFWENDSLSDGEFAPVIIEINARDDSKSCDEDEICDEVVSGSSQPHIPGPREGFSAYQVACLCGLTPDMWYATLPLRELLQQHDDDRYEYAHHKSACNPLAESTVNMHSDSSQWECRVRTPNTLVGKRRKRQNGLQRTRQVPRGGKGGQPEDEPVLLWPRLQASNGAGNSVKEPQHSFQLPPPPPRMLAQEAPGATHAASDADYPGSPSHKCCQGY
ncbi:hypothetical protein HPB47_009751 [Ixodes persulcatus]|uniref:Uncharacterized protein n=1 Tax=Ixodes persulcatus TaxID=34615 RepID=A0AC60P0Z4_IXOPE|nr:hypothetical protein HPB47_009751 [Ixodes persulcatus]